MRSLLRHLPACLFGILLTMAVCFSKKIAGEAEHLRSMKDFLVNCSDLEWLSKDCLVLLRMGESSSGEIVDINDEIFTVASMRFLKPARMYIENHELVVVFTERSSVAFAMKCKQDGSLWLYGDLMPTPPALVYPKH